MHSIIQLLCSVGLQLRISLTKPCYDLQNTVPNVVLHFGDLDESHHHVYIPDEILCEFFSQDGYLQHKFILNKQVSSRLQIS